ARPDPRPDPERGEDRSESAQVHASASHDRFLRQDPRQGGVPEPSAVRPGPSGTPHHRGTSLDSMPPMAASDPGGSLLSDLASAPPIGSPNLSRIPASREIGGFPR